MIWSADKKYGGGLLVILAITAIVFSAESENDVLTKFGVPEGTPLRCGHFMVAVDGATRGPRWVIEHLRSGEFAPIDRDGISFKSDQRIPREYRARAQDYIEPNYDIGHMAPAANARTREEVKATFTLSNAWPQTHEFNAGIWLTLEKEVRRIASANESWVVSAPIWNSHQSEVMNSIGSSRIRVPPAFGKAMLSRSGISYTLRSWIIPHTETSRKPLNEYRVATDEFEERSGLDVWSQLATADVLEREK